ncbi:MAG: AraC family transcriptional regulator [Eubacteriales bacterium]|jgi:AraC-like DNA-binding protein
MSEPLNPICIRRSFQVDHILSAYHRENYIETRPPYDENYPFWQVTYLLSGAGSYESDGMCWPYTAGDVLFRRAGNTSRITYGPGAVSYAIISFSCTSEALKTLPHAPVRLYGEERATLLDLIKTGVRICEPVRGETGLRGFQLRRDTPPQVLEFVGVSLERFLIMVSCRLAGVLALTDESEKSNRHVGETETAREVRRYLETHFLERLTIAELAGRFGFSETVLMKQYKREFGLSIGESLTQMRIEYAKARIRDSGLNFTQIAEELGVTPGYFSRIFRIHEGITPTAYSRMVSKRP